MAEIIKISPITHREEKRIKVEFPRTSVFLALIKKVKGRKWSKTKTCWHIPYTEAAYGELKEVFKEYSIEKLVTTATTSSEETQTEAPVKKRIESKKPTIKIETVPPSSSNTISQIQPSAKVILKLCPNDENHIRVYIPKDHIAWRMVVKYIPKSKLEDNYWIVPKNQTSIDILRARIGEASLKAMFDISIYPKKPLQEVAPEGMLLGNTITLKKENEKWIRVYVPWNQPIWIETIKNIAGQQWHIEKKCWLIPYVQQSFKILWKHLKPHIDLQFKINPNIPKTYISLPKPKKQKQHKKPKTSPAFQKLSIEHQKEVFALENVMLLKRMAHSTIKTYKIHFIDLLLFYPKKLVKDITLNEIKSYLIDTIQTKQIAWHTQNQIINAIKFYYEHVQYNNNMVIHIPRPKKAKEKIDTLNRSEVAQLLNVITNLKHKCLVGLLVSSGLRVGEVIKLKVGDIKWERKMIFVKAGKGRKDRLTIVSTKVLNYLKTYIEIYHVVDWLFEGQHGGFYSIRNVQNIVLKAGEDAKLKIRIHPYLLRHTFTSLTEDDGVFSVTEIQHFLGHEHIKERMRYLSTGFNKIRNKRNFLDGLDV